MKGLLPLKGVKVLEMGSAISGPMCGMILGEMGAEVIKVENTEKGDDARFMGKIINGESIYFSYYNKNKKSIAIDLKTKEGREIIKKIIRKVDVLIQNFSPGVMNKLGLSLRTVKKLNPKLVYCSISGFGDVGKYSNFRGYDLVIQAMSGLMWMNRRPGDEPLRLPIPITDILAAWTAASAVCAALYFVRKRRCFVKIDVSLLHAGVAAMGQWLVQILNTGQDLEPFGNRYPALAPYEPFKTKDSWVVVAVGNDEQWRKLCTAISRLDLMNDSRFASNQGRTASENREKLHEELVKTFSNYTCNELVELLQRVGVPAGPVRSLSEITSDEYFTSESIFRKIYHPRLGEIYTIQTTPNFNNGKADIRASPTHGQHTEQILRSLGLTQKRVEDYVKRRIVKTNNSI
ncbi:MAG: CaiB/BaiF CoA-transferase family protein [Candidatus Caldarchaeum sp.]